MNELVVRSYPESSGQWLSIWIRSVRSDVPQGTILQLMLFNTFINEDSGIECTFSNFADNIKLCYAVDTPEGWGAIQKYLDKLEQWV